MSRVLIVDDEPSICWTLTEALGDEGHQCRTASTAEEGLGVAREFQPDVVLLDVRLPGRSGLETMGELRALDPTAAIVVMTAFGDLATAVRAVSQGAFEYLVKPFELDEALRVVARAERERGSSLEQAASRGPVDAELLGHSARMQEVFKQIALAATSDVPVLITGESGTGKELVAEAIHRHSRRSDRPYLPVVLAAMSENLIESELFGHVRGAFTGAERERVGVFGLVDGGTVMLDEIGDVPLATQVKLLRTIERHEWLPVGDARTRSGDFRVIAATHRPLAEMMADGRFREDLYYRLAVFHIQLPPLRERREDIALLAQAFLDRSGIGGEGRHFSSAALQLLETRDWPGNVRELKNVVERAAVVSRAREIGPESIPEPFVKGRSTLPDEGLDSGRAIEQAVRRWSRETLDRDSQEIGRLHERLLEIVEPPLIQETLESVQENRLAAAGKLGIHRATLRQKMRRYGLDPRNDDEL